ncbi:hypothetical protein E2C01_015100 [Portunus trituberculatus]|uniref:Uncharacterized protein n=1 Tax=Portunus trituberculatus TaxID=210409 RepID=A0A5B7DM24_PORTR|nr:hypothetical protein [Portunus trituberculatus]
MTCCRLTAAASPRRLGSCEGAAWQSSDARPPNPAGVLGQASLVPASLSAPLTTSALMTLTTNWPAVISLFCMYAICLVLKKQRAAHQGETCGTAAKSDKILQYQ